MNLYMVCPMPECTHEQMISEVDPDASLSDLFRHFLHDHPDTNPEFLLTIVEEVER